MKFAKYILLIVLIVNVGRLSATTEPLPDIGGKFGEKLTFEESQPFEAADDGLEYDNIGHTIQSDNCYSHIWLNGKVSIRTISLWFAREDTFKAWSKTTYGSKTKNCNIPRQSKEISVQIVALVWNQETGEYEEIIVKKNTKSNASYVKAKRKSSNTFLAILSNSSNIDIAKTLTPNEYLADYILGKHDANTSWNKALSSISKVEFKF